MPPPISIYNLVSVAQVVEHLVVMQEVPSSDLGKTETPFKRDNEEKSEEGEQLKQFPGLWPTVAEDKNKCTIMTSCK